MRMVLSAQMGKAGPPMNGKDLHTGDLGARPAAGGCAAGHRRADAWPAWRWRSRATERARGRLAHRRGRLVAGRVARSHQPLRRPPAAGRLLRAEQSDGALDAGPEQSAVRVFADKAAGYGIPGHHHRRHRSRRDRRGVRLGGRTRARRARARADRAGLDAHVRARAPRRHAVSRQGCRRRRGPTRRSPTAATPTAICMRSGRRAIRFRPTRRGSRRKA